MKFKDSEIETGFKDVNWILVENFCEATVFSWTYLIAYDLLFNH